MVDRTLALVRAYGNSHRAGSSSGAMERFAARFLGRKPGIDSQRQQGKSVASRRSFRQLPEIRRITIIEQSARPVSDSRANSSALFVGFGYPLATCQLAGLRLEPQDKWWPILSKISGQAMAAQLEPPGILDQSACAKMAAFDPRQTSRVPN